MTVFLISLEDEKRLKAAVERAQANPIPWAVLQTGISANQDSDNVTLTDRERAPEIVRDHVQVPNVMLPFGWRVAISCEEQPAGRLLHVSMSSPVKGKIPTELAMKLVIEACGFTLEDCARGWLEEFERGWKAINVLIILGAPSGVAIQ
jgi:hypothetical protein